MLLLAGTFLSTTSENINYGAKGDRPAGSFVKREAFILDAAGRPHTLRLAEDFHDSALGQRGSQVVVAVRPSTFRGELQLTLERVMSADEVRQTLGQPGGLRAAESKTA